MADCIVRLDRLISGIRGSSRALLSCHALVACSLTHSICMLLQQRLTDRSKERVARCCLSVKLEQKQTLKFYQPTKTRGFLKITVALPTMIPGLKGVHCCFATQERPDPSRYCEVCCIPLAGCEVRRYVHASSCTS